MSIFCARDNHLSHVKFRDLPEIGDIKAVIQPSPSIDGWSPASSVSEISLNNTASGLREGDLVTGIIDLANVRTQMVSIAKNKYRSEEKSQVVRTHPASAPNHFDQPASVRSGTSFP